MKIRILIVGFMFLATTLFAAGNVWADGYRGRGDRRHGSDRHYYQKHRPNRGHHQPPGHWKRGRHGNKHWKDRGHYGRHDRHDRHGRGYGHDRPRYRDHHRPKHHYKKHHHKKHHYEERHHKKHYRYYPPLLPHHYLGLSLIKPGFAFSIGGYDR